MHANRIIVILCSSFSPIRGFLSPASGFQSTQFRLLEIMLGLREELRVQYAECPFTYVAVHCSAYVQMVGRHEVAYKN